MGNKNKNGHFVNTALPLGTWGCGYNEESFLFVFSIVYFFLRISSVTIFSGGVVSFLAGGLNESRPTPSDIGLRVTNECRDFGPHKRQSQLETFFRE
jgi:hypothetical protein